jgi:hypothetical protein
MTSGTRSNCFSTTLRQKTWAMSTCILLLQAVERKLVNHALVDRPRSAQTDRSIAAESDGRAPSLALPGATTGGGHNRAFASPWSLLPLCLELRGDLYDHVPPLRLRSQHQRSRQSRLDHIPQLVAAVRSL